MPSDNERQAIGRRLRGLRQELGLSQSAFAERYGAKRISQHFYEKGTRVPPSEYLLALCRDGVDVNWLLKGKAGETSR